MREIVRECGDLFLVQRKSDLRHRGLAAAGAQAGFVIAQSLQQIILALARKASDCLGARVIVGVA